MWAVQDIFIGRTPHDITAVALNRLTETPEDVAHCFLAQCMESFKNAPRKESNLTLSIKLPEEKFRLHPTINIQLEGPARIT